MYYGLIPLFMIPIFILWVLHHLFIKKDLKKYRTEVFAGFTFIVIWTVIYITII